MVKEKRKVRKGSTWVKQEFLVRMLRTKIIRGIYPPGERVPTRDDLEKEYKASRITIQRAFDTLRKEGFLTPRGRAGTFVHITPPHLYHIALIFPFQSEFPSKETGLGQALIKAANKHSKEGPEHFVTLPGFHNTDHLDLFRELEEDVLMKRLAGVVFVGTPDAMANSTLYTARTLPRVVIGTPGTNFGTMGVELDRSSFYTQALTFLAEKKRHRIALINTGGHWPHEQANLQRCIANQPMLTDLAWLHHVHPDAKDSVEHLIHLMMKASPEDRPNGFIVTDDSLIAPITHALAEKGIPRDACNIVCQSIYPRRGLGYQYTTWLGYDGPLILQAALDRLRAQITNTTIPPIAHIKARFIQSIK